MNSSIFSICPLSIHVITSYSIHYTKLYENLSLYRDPIVAKNTSESDFFISDIMNLETPVDLYLVVSPANLDRLRPLLRVFFNLALRKFTQKMAFENG